MEVDDQLNETNELMYLDEEAIRSLDLVDLKRSTTKGAKTIYSVLNRCKTVSGKALLTYWLEHPLADLNAINKRLDIVEIFYSNNTLRDDISNCLAKLPDLKRLTNKLSSKKSTLIDCCKIYQSFFFINNLVEILESERNDLFEQEFLINLKEMQKKCSDYSKLIEENVDQESLERGDPLIDSKQDDSLAGIGEQMSNLKERVEKAFADIADDLDLEIGKTIKLEICPTNGYVARITRKYDDKLRNDKKEKYRVLGTKKDGVRFTNAQLDRLSASYLRYREEYEEIQKTIFDEILDKLKVYCKPLDSLIDIISKLDVYFSLADAAKYPHSYVRPILMPKGTGKIKITNLRHPCLENQINVYFIPNSIDFDKDNKKFFIITGPNMGGKSTFLRSIGVAVLLAQIGSFVPADEATISIVDAIFTRVGASDKQHQGISTFKAEMLETSEILNRATSDSLVIIDELGRGTSSFDGYGLAYSISKEIALNIKSYCLFATHFHELTLLADEVNTVDNLFVNYEFDEKECNLKMLYEIQHGVCDQKFGIHVAKMVQFPDQLIEHAQERVRKYELIENPPNKEQLLKISNLIKSKASELKELSDDQLLDELNRLVADEENN